MTVEIKKCSFAEIEGNANFPALIREYVDEALIRDLAPPTEKFAAYRQLEGTGMFHIYGAFAGAKLVGVIALLIPVMPHFGVAIAMSESFFVAKDYRKQGAGLALLRAAQAKAREEKSPGMFVSAPSGGQLAEVLPKLGYRETNRVFLRTFAND